MDGRSTSEVDNRSAVDVGGLRRGTKSVHVKKPQFSEPFQWQLWKKVRTSQLCKQKRWVHCELPSTRSTLSLRGGDRSWWMRIDTPSVKPFAKESKKRNGKLCSYHFREVHHATGTKKPSGSQKVKAFCAMKAARDGDEEFHDPARKERTFWGECGKNMLDDCYDPMS